VVTSEAPATLPQTWNGPGGQSLDLRVQPFINGHAVESESSKLWSKYSPTNGCLLMQFPEGSAADVDRAVRSARTAADDGRWSDLSPGARKGTLLKLAELIEDPAHDLALMDSLEVGKLIRDAENIDRVLAASILRMNAETAERVYGVTAPADGRALAVTTRGPRGVVAGIVGWNFPLVLAVMKLAPALATGNCLVLKPSELSSLSTLKLAALALQAGVPEGVFNVVTGAGAIVGDALARHPDIDMLTFTGSTATGRLLLAALGESAIKPLLLECGGKSPNIVLDDCPNLDAVADAVVARMYWNQGQVCTAGTRLLVHAPIKDALLERIRARAAALVPGDPLDPNTTCGPLISEPQLTKVLGYIADGKASGAQIVLGGKRTLESSGGYFVETTIFDHVHPNMRIAREEIFGPVLSVMTFKDVDEAIQLANSTIYGLSATVWTQSIHRVQKMMKGLRAGEIDIKATARPSAGLPLGALAIEPHKQSGIGIEGGLEGLQSYTVLRTIKIFVD
jgi:acyl-CoA reductase-like NAD-dependent aldehyde dehydrogenase